MSQKYTDARYPEKINDLIDNEGNVNPEIIPPAPSGGTKLYIHSITFTNKSDPGTNQITIVSNIKEPATSLREAQQIIRGFAYSYNGTTFAINSNQCFYVLEQTSYDLSVGNALYQCLFNTSSGSYSSQKIKDNVVLKEDIVTEL